MELKKMGVHWKKLDFNSLTCASYTDNIRNEGFFSWILTTGQGQMDHLPLPLSGACTAARSQEKTGSLF